MASTAYKIGVDIGGTNMKAVLFNGSKIIEESSLSTPQDNPEHFFNIFKALIAPLLERTRTEKKKIAGIGISIAGMHDFHNGRIAYPPNLTYLNGVEIIRQLEQRFGVSAKFDNDTNCFLRAEAKLGSAEKFNNVFGITVGTGIGGGWWLNRKIYRGSHGSAGEIGHIVTQFSEAKTLEKIYQELASNDLSEIAYQAYQGNEKSERIFERIGEYLGYTCANVVNILDPEAIIIGGGVAQSDELFFPVIKKTMQSHIASPLSQKTKILKAKLGNNAGAIGAALLHEDQ